MAPRPDSWVPKAPTHQFLYVKVAGTLVLSSTETVNLVGAGPALQESLSQELFWGVGLSMLSESELRWKCGAVASVRADMCHRENSRERSDEENL